MFRNDLSVVVPMFNAGDTLTDALDSIRRQTLQPAVVHLVDDRSPCSDAARALAYVTENNVSNWQIHLLKENLGAGGARDFAIRRCTTTYIALLDADDIWLMDHLEKAMKVVDSLELDLFGAQMHKMSQGEFFLPDPKEDIVTEVKLRRLLFRCCFLTSTVIFRRESYIQAGGFLPDLRLSEDYSLWLRIASDPENSCAITNRVQTLYRDSNTETTIRLSNNHWKHEQAEIKNFVSLHKQGSINFIMLFLSISFSLLKYFRRLIAFLARRTLGIFHL